MVTFTWKPVQYESGGQFIEWSAKWDGRWDNDELVDDGCDSLGHPFAGTDDYEHSKHMENVNPAELRECGEIVADNPVTRAMCDLLSSPELLTKFCGNTAPGYYRRRLLIALRSLWD